MENKLKDPVAIEKKQNFRSIGYKKLNDLYETFVHQKELSAEQKYFPSVYMPSGTSSNASTSSAPPATMPKSTTLKHDVQKCVLMYDDFVNIDEIEKVKRESMDVQENLLKRIKILENDF
ncbi:hypothetical protein Tco_1089753 [Tanacetum coccineum]